ncbi:MmcB family DNA repair protein [Pararhodobacter sp.]|uniref:MmcB family DNA repair protein n=1 Tax=Pararhodobacter sp. TaxID=2127056 RepID=UPI002AFFA162|nr:MmcB family DNA repair protein [Pararhodobacter sp.]
MDTQGTLQAGQRLARGVCRLLRSHDFATLDEVTPIAGLRVDVMGLGPKGEIWVVECKSCRADFTSDHKWQGYLDWCDRFFWAVPAEFPTEILPAETGLIVADDYFGDVITMAPLQPLAAARRKVLTVKFARMAALRHHAMRDPRP